MFNNNYTKEINMNERMTFQNLIQRIFALVTDIFKYLILCFKYINHFSRFHYLDGGRKSLKGKLE